MDDSDVMLGAARVRDPSIAQLMATAQNAAVFENVNNEWVRTYEGSFMLFNRNVKPQYGFIVLDRNRPDYLVELFADGATVTHEESASTGMSNTVKYISAHGQPVYMLAFESVTIAQSIFQKLKQAVLLVSVSRRGSDRRASHPQKHPQNGPSPVPNGLGHASQNGNVAQKISAQNEHTMSMNGSADRQKGLFSQLLTAKANYEATHTPEANGDSQSPKGSSKKHKSSAHARSTAMTATWENQVTPSRNGSTGMYYAKPSAPTVSLNPLSNTNCTVKVEGSASKDVNDRALVEVQNGVETSDSPAKPVKMQPISLKQLFGKAEGITNVGLNSAMAHGETATSSPIGLLPPKTACGDVWSFAPVTDSSSSEAFNKLLSAAIGLPKRLSNANGSTDTAQSGATDTTSSISNGNYPSGDELSGSNDGQLDAEPHYSRQKDTDAVDSDSLLIAPDAFVTRSDKDTDDNRILLDMVMMHRAGESASLEQATDMRVEDRSRTGSSSDTSGEPSSTTANDEVVSRSYSNSAHSKSNSNLNTDSSESPRNNERPFERRTRNKHALQLTKEQLRATLIDLLENDDEFVKRLHQNYTQLLLRPRCDATHSTK